MADVFFKKLDPADFSLKTTSVSVYMDDGVSPHEYAAHAINSHDELVRQRDELLAVIADHNRLIRELDVLLNGEAGAAKQASLCDIVAQLRHSPGAGKMVPEGWQLVPVSATKDMWAAWDSAPCGHEDDMVNLECAYQAMLAAAPKLGGE